MHVTGFVRAMGTTQPRLLFTLLVLLGINTMNFFDRQVLGAVGEPIKREWQLSAGTTESPLV
jgi:hypothetical protein